MSTSVVPLSLPDDSAVVPVPVSPLLLVVDMVVGTVVLTGRESESMS